MSRAGSISSDVAGTRSAASVGRPPRRIAWVLLLASTAAVLLTGLLATLLVLLPVATSVMPVSVRFWRALAVAAALTVASVFLRSLRWIFLLRRAQVRIPIRDAYIGYFAGLTLLLAPFLLGEIAVRAAVHRSRGRVPVATTVVVNLWERFLDLSAIALLAAVLAAAIGRFGPWSFAALVASLATAVPAVRRGCLRLAVAATRPLASWFDEGRESDAVRLAESRAWIAASVVSVAAWTLPGIAFWHVANSAGHPVDLLTAEQAYASSAALGGVVLAPGGVLVTGGYLLASLQTFGVPVAVAALAVFGIRLATLGVATMLGGVFLLVHLRWPALAVAHFDEIADAYDVQIPESRRQALLTRKTALMHAEIVRLGIGPRGLDAGCGQGAYVARMRELGFDVSGIDSSAGQVDLATRHVVTSGLVARGSLLHIPAADASFDFVYTINVLHHLGSMEEQRQAFAELLRVIRPGGLLFVHEINTRNVFFRFYMGYVFPTLNCIDEGVERWLVPHRLNAYTDAPVTAVRYFTFMPEFVPRLVVRALTPLERLLEASPLAVYSAHYMAVLRKP